MNQVVIFVEGEYDQKILDKLGFGSYLKVQRGAGKFGMKAFMLGFSEAGVVKAKHVLAFRDRDFDYPIPDAAVLGIPQEDKGRILVSHRVTIENYLLNSDNFGSFLNSLKKDSWEGMTMDRFGDNLHKAAYDIRAYQAARHALGAVRRPNHLGTTWMQKSGSLPANLDAKICLENGIACLEEYASLATEIADIKEFERHFEGFLSKFDQTFFDNGDYLIWFQAKDLQTRFSQLASAEGLNFPFKSFYEYATRNFDYTRFPDLVQLHAHLTNLIEN